MCVLIGRIKLETRERLVPYRLALSSKTSGGGGNVLYLCYLWTRGSVVHAKSLCVVGRCKCLFNFILINPEFNLAVIGGQ